MMDLKNVKTPLALGLALLVTPSAQPEGVHLTTNQKNPNVHKSIHPKKDEQLTRSDLNKIKMRYGPYGEVLAIDLNKMVKLFNQRARNQGQIGLELDLDHNRINLKDPSQILNHDYVKSFENSNKGYLLKIAALEDGKTFAAYLVDQTHYSSGRLIQTSILNYIE